MFEHGLLLKVYSLRSISKTVLCMPIALFGLFLESHHPKLVASESMFPRPSEWEFEEGEEILLRNSTKRGVINALGLHWVEVLVTGEGDVRVPWLDIRKVDSVGQFVEVTAGVYRGQKGWVDTVVTGGMYQELSGWQHKMYDHVAGIVKDPDGQKRLTPDSIEVCDIPKNCKGNPLRFRRSPVFRFRFQLPPAFRSRFRHLVSLPQCLWSNDILRHPLPTRFRSRSHDVA